MQTETAFTGKTKEIFTAKTEIRSAGRTGKRLFVSLQLIPEEHPEEQLAELESHRKDYEKELQEYRNLHLNFLRHSLMQYLQIYILMQLR